MNFDFSDELKQLRDQARRFLSERCPPAVVRRVLEGDAPLRPRSVAGDGGDGLARRGDPGSNTAAPDSATRGLCVLAEELGRALAPVPFASSAYLASEAICCVGSDGAKAAWLPQPRRRRRDRLLCAWPSGRRSPIRATVRARAAAGG